MQLLKYFSCFSSEQDYVEGNVTVKLIGKTESAPFSISNLCGLSVKANGLSKRSRKNKEKFQIELLQEECLILKGKDSMRSIPIEKVVVIQGDKRNIFILIEKESDGSFHMETYSTLNKKKMNEICQFFNSTKWEFNDCCNTEISSTDEANKITAPSPEECVAKNSVESGISSNSDTTVVDTSDTTSFADTTISSPIASTDDIIKATSAGSNVTSSPPQLAAVSASGVTSTNQDKDMKATSLPSESTYPYQSPVMYKLNDDDSLKSEDYCLSDTSSLLSLILETDNVSTILNSTMKQDGDAFSKVDDDDDDSLCSVTDLSDCSSSSIGSLFDDIQFELNRRMRRYKSEPILLTVKD